MRRALSITGWVALVLFTGVVMHDSARGVTWAAISGALSVGLGLWLFRHHRTERVIVTAGAVATGLYWLASAYYGPSWVWVTVWAVVAATAGVAWLITHRSTGPRPVKGARWWTGPALVEAFTTAGILKAPKDDEPRPMLLVKVAKDDYGTTVTVKLPPGVVFSTVEGKREALAAALGQPLHLVTVTQARADAANSATIRVTLPFERTIREHNIPEVTSWRDPLTIARDRRGRDVTIQTYNTGQVLVGGRTGSGKTHFLRLLASHFALDPDASLFIADGKGSTDDWGPIRDRCEELVFVHDEAPAVRFMGMIAAVQDLVTDRNRQGGRDWPGCLVILEEFSSMLATLDSKGKREAEVAVTRLVQTCRSANVLVVIAAQRPSASTMDTSTRAQAAVSVALAMKSATDTVMCLGHQPTLDLPTEPGEAIVTVPGKDDVFVDLDTIPDGAWVSLCASLPPREVEPVWLPEVVAETPADRTVAVTYDPPTFVRVVPDDVPRVEPSPRDAVLAYLGGVESGRPGQIVEATGFAQRTVELALAGLVRSGDVVKPARGVYSLPVA